MVRRGAAKVYGAARHPDQVTEPGVTPVALDITDQDRVAEVAAQCTDVSLLINNAGVLKDSTFINAPSLEAARAEMETNYFGTLSMCRAFAPVLAANGRRDQRAVMTETEDFLAATLPRLTEAETVACGSRDTSVAAPGLRCQRVPGWNIAPSQAILHPARP